jgi:hypothetical protein
MPVAKLAPNTITIKKPKYARADPSVKKMAEKASTVNTAQLIKSESVMRHVYDAFFCSFARI